jgi:hypothetical protein
MENNWPVPHEDQQFTFQVGNIKEIPLDNRLAICDAQKCRHLFKIFFWHPEILPRQLATI